MKPFLPFYLLLFLLFTACGYEAAYEYPEIADQHISFTIDGVSQSLKGVDNDVLQGTSFVVDDQNSTNNQLLLQRTSSDKTTKMEIKAYNLPVQRLEKGMSYTQAGYSPATITVTSSEMSGSLYCPHEEDGNQLTYSAQIRFDSYVDGRMRGTFMTRPGPENAVEITSGSFDLMVQER